MRGLHAESYGCADCGPQDASRNLMRNPHNWSEECNHTHPAKSMSCIMVCHVRQHQSISKVTQIDVFVHLADSFLLFCITLPFGFNFGIALLDSELHLLHAPNYLATLWFGALHVGWSWHPWALKCFTGHICHLGLQTSGLVTLHPFNNHQAIVVLLFHHLTQGMDVFMTGRHLEVQAGRRSHCILKELIIRGQ
eukprot:6491684-Amphidinium_carterae.10